MLCPRKGGQDQRKRPFADHRADFGESLLLEVELPFPPGARTAAFFFPQLISGWAALGQEPTFLVF